ncbi:MAG: NADH:flavin oxidoreductase, partial [Gammaproteobacteria bacterium]|nr:NADH:flavin oxidoreductase [Gammaproteobacteria bacterium]
EFNWLTLRSKGGFGMTMSCASHVQSIGKGFPGQLGIYDDMHIDGLKSLTDQIKSFDSLAVAQLHHAGMRSPEEIIGERPVCPSSDDETNSRELSLDEVKRLRDDFIFAAIRAKKSGYDGVEIHGAHGYILCQFLSSTINKREDEYGGSLDNRSRIILEIINGIRQECGKKFLLGVRLSPERFGMKLDEIKSICKKIISMQKIDFIDMSLWDCFKYPDNFSKEDPNLEKIMNPEKIEKNLKKTLLEHFTDLDFKNVLLTVAGNIRTGKDVHKIIGAGVDFAAIGRAAIVHHDFPKKVLNNPAFEPLNLPVSKAHLKNEGVSDKFIEYLRFFKGFVE